MMDHHWGLLTPPPGQSRTQGQSIIAIKVTRCYVWTATCSRPSPHAVTHTHCLRRLNVLQHHTAKYCVWCRQARLSRPPTSDTPLCCVVLQDNNEVVVVAVAAVAGVGGTAYMSSCTAWS